MSQKAVNRVTGFIGSLTLSVFVLGLAESITSGFAGVVGGMPFWMITVSILVLVWYDYYDSCIRNPRPAPENSR